MDNIEISNFKKTCIHLSEKSCTVSDCVCASYSVRAEQSRAERSTHTGHSHYESEREGERKKEEGEGLQERRARETENRHPHTAHWPQSTVTARSRAGKEGWDAHVTYNPLFSLPITEEIFHFSLDTCMIM